MTVPICPDHADLMRELARGHLDDEQSLRAETIREECSECARWWNEAFSGEAYDAVDRAVAEVISGFAPAARRRYRGLAAAAGLVLAAGVGALSLLWRDAETSSVTPGEVVSTWDFETIGPDEVVTIGGEATNGVDNVHSTDAMFSSDFESGDLGGWSPFS